tara:strand:+ start:2485 stop:2967 length:483 start_codon:yes stop_codon:yes gene_type:complete
MLILRAIWPYALALLVGFVIAYAWQDNRYTARLSELNSKLQKASQVAVTQALEEQQRQSTAAETQGAKGEETVNQISADIAADDTGERLRAELASVRKRASRENASLATQLVTARQTIGVLTHMLESCSGFAGTVAGAFEDARARGLTCQAVYNEIRSNE